MNREVILILKFGLSRSIVWPPNWNYKVHSLVFLNMTDAQAKEEVYNWSWEDRADWLSGLEIRTYSCWKIEEVLEFESMLWPGIELEVC